MRQLVSIFVAIFIGSAVTYYFTEASVGKKAFQTGVEAGRGKLRSPLPATVYELRLVGVPAVGTEAYYDMKKEGANDEVAFVMPAGFQVGDRIVYLPAKGFVKVN